MIAVVDNRPREGVRVGARGRFHVNDDANVFAVKVRSAAAKLAGFLIDPIGRRFRHRLAARDDGIDPGVRMNCVTDRENVVVLLRRQKNAAVELADLGKVRPLVAAAIFRPAHNLALKQFGLENCQVNAVAEVLDSLARGGFFLHARELEVGRRLCVDRPQASLRNTRPRVIALVRNALIDARLDVCTYRRDRIHRCSPCVATSATIFAVMAFCQHA
jgi:hypothetical protein